MALRIFALGATGNIGRHFMDRALARGHRVTAFVRTPAKITRRDPNLEVVTGDRLRAETMATALRGHDAVVSSLGPRGLDGFRESTLLSECAASTVSAMRQADVGRIAIVSAALLFPEKGIKFAFFRWLLRNHIDDLSGMESVVRATPFAYTIARPPRLVENSESRYRQEVDALPAEGFTMSFSSVAAFLLESLEGAAFERKVVGLAAPRDV